MGGSGAATPLVTSLHCWRFGAGLAKPWTALDATRYWVDAELLEYLLEYLDSGLDEMRLGVVQIWRTGFRYEVNLSRVFLKNYTLSTADLCAGVIPEIAPSLLGSSQKCF